MKINGKDLETFDATLVSFVYVTSGYDGEINIKYMSHKLINYEVSPKIKLLKLVFNSEIGISNFMVEILNGAIIDNDDSFIYDCLLKDGPSIKHISCDIYEVGFSFYTLQKEQKRSLNLPKLVNTIYIGGNGDTKATIGILPRLNMPFFEVFGIRINNIHANQKIVIDSEKCIITENGANKFFDSDIKKWPVVHPGRNVVRISSTDADVVLSYYPFYI